MRRIIKGFAIGISLLGLLIVGHNGQVKAAAQTQQSDFEVQAILPEEQVNQGLNFFNLKLATGQTKKIQMRVQNFTDHSITVHSDLRNAKTQVGGGLGFTANTAHLDKSLKIPLTTIAVLAKKDRTIKLAAKEARIITTTIKAPEENYPGIIYGDWHFIEYMKNSKKGGSAVTSNYAYSVGLALRGKPYKVYPELKYQSTDAILYSNHAAMGVKLRNIKPMMLNNVSAKAIISKSGFNGSKHVAQVSSKSIAPNSQFVIPLTWSFDQLKPGKYTVDVAVKGQNLWNKLPMTWHFKKHFTVNKQEAESINKQAMKKPINAWAYVATASGILTIASLISLIWVFKLR